MPQALVPVIVKLGVSKLVASIAAYAITAAATSFLSSILTGAGNTKPESTERELKLPTPPRLYGMGRRRWYGAQMLFDTAANGTTGDVWAFLDCPAGPIEGVERVYLNDDLVTLAGDVVQGLPDGRYSGPRVRVGWRLGLMTETAYANLVTLFPGVWTAGHRGDGIFSGYLTKDPVEAKDFIKVYPQGDQITMSLVAKSYRCFDPRNPAHDPHNPATWAWTENAALHLLWFYMVYRGLDFGTQILPVIGHWATAASVCDEPVPLKAGGTEPRYRGCVAWDSSKLPGDIVNEMLACFDGWTAQDANGCQVVYAGKITAPVFRIGPEHIVSSSRQFFVEDEDRINELVVQYVSEQHDWNVVEGQSWRDEGDISKRGRIDSDGFAPQSPSFPQNRRLAKRRQARQNAPQRGKITTTVGGRDVLSHRYIELEDVEAGATFYSGWAEVVGGERDYETGGAVFDWVAVNPDVDSWNPSTEEGEPAPVGNRVVGEPLPTPVVLSATAVSETYGVNLAIEVQPPERTDLTWYARFRVEGAAVWGADMTYADIDPGQPVSLIVGLVPADEEVEVQVAYGVGDGRVSDWSATSVVSTPPPPTP
ncbi:hypothetical protein [Sphingomonas xinjiangensis]|uniref:Tip attachment protein J domain-containing protein n=1 Tax=Sphingomonas xinjiangensis TaxID=643568 RepID=A0A840YPG2_9SPHN|nr:hypothetical protein [Sphingomonas xinjiangensis]MBB5709353.1 hypothetical protein [Sphingomonas xinjiangensis]